MVSLGGVTGVLGRRLSEKTCWLDHTALKNRFLSNSFCIYSLFLFFLSFFLFFFFFFFTCVLFLVSHFLCVLIVHAWTHNRTQPISVQPAGLFASLSSRTDKSGGFYCLLIFSLFCFRGCGKGAIFFLFLFFVFSSFLFVFVLLSDCGKVSCG